MATDLDRAREAHIRDDVDFVHTGPGTLAGRYMRRFWHPVSRSEDLPTGHAKPARILGDDFTLYRDEHGVAHAIGFRCAHRGAQLSVGYVEGDCIRCFYHGWVFNPQGECVERPAEKTPPTQRHRVAGYPTQEYLGLIFVFFGEGEAPPLPRYPRVEGDGVREVTVDVMPANFFFSLENSALHFNFVHRDLMEKKGLRGLPTVRFEESDFGIVSYARWEGMTTDMISHKGLPNVGYIIPLAIMMSKKRNYQIHVSWRVPVDDESHTTFRVTRTPVTGDEARELLASRPPSYYDRSSIPILGDAVIAGKLRIQDIEDRTHIEFIQDYVAQVAQGPVSTRADEHLASSDAGETLLRRIWRRELTALAEGRPLKEWRLTEAIEPSMEEFAGR
jgi:5,5'-dehydrodivanillate O-demethylase oxygenase subunit